MSTEPVRDHLALVDLLEARMRAPFAWGKRANDCASFAATAVAVQGGPDVLGRLPDWSTQRGAVRVLRQRGGLEAIVGTLLAAVPTALAARGDVALVMTSTGPALMVVEGATLVGPGPSGLVRRPRADMVRAWSAL